jgi:hypothetical protein
VRLPPAGLSRPGAKSGSSGRIISGSAIVRKLVKFCASGEGAVCCRIQARIILVRDLYTKYPRAQKCCPTKLRLRSAYTRAR